MIVYTFIMDLIEFIFIIFVNVISYFYFDEFSKNVNKKVLGRQ